ncbi:hypothetical protein [Sphingosinicella sp. YJ22]|uniref:hypothetical protein n=1 Tax=Sphingosinicella sp. YJ22 TaxID=1104780 RepID=UPI00140AAAEB|nr:hypothetical protein [Sphingosinicella sp. YJ22]
MIWGAVISAAYLAMMILYVSLGSHSVSSLELNALGDFLAGTFSPLAFFWLVLGFIQQGHELRHSADALWLQGQELQKSVEQQRELVGVTREQLALEQEARKQLESEASRAALPTLVLHEVGTTIQEGSSVYHLRLLNLGTTCTLLTIYVFDHAHNEAPSLETDGNLSFTVRFKGQSLVRPVPVTVRFTDRRGRKASQVFELVPAGAGQPTPVTITAYEPAIAAPLATDTGQNDTV